MEVINAIGRRKAAVARIYMSEGTGKVTVNKTRFTVKYRVCIYRYVYSLVDNIDHQINYQLLQCIFRLKNA